jgi:hypothetical protein
MRPWLPAARGRDGEAGGCALRSHLFRLDYQWMFRQNGSFDRLGITMADLVIKIIRTKDASGAFLPVQPKAQPGDPLKAYEDDTVIWKNTTDQRHWPWPADKNFKGLDQTQVSKEKGNYLSGEIPPHSPSDVIYNLPENGGTIFYCCKLHEGEHGTIIVRPIRKPKPPVA